MFWKIFLLALFFAVTTAVAIMSKKAAKNTDDFVLGGRKVGPWLSAFAYGTSYFSATIFVGYSGQFGWAFGISALWIGLGNALIGSLLAWVGLGRRTRIMTKHINASTMPEFFEKRYNSRAVKIVASLIICVFLVPYTASVYKGLAGIFAACFGNIDFVWCIIGMAVLTLIFVFVGGYVGTAANNLIQGIIMLVGIVLIVGAVLSGQGGFTEAVNRLSQVESEARPALGGAFTSIFGPDPMALLSVVILTSLGTWGLPQMIHKFYAIKDEKAVKTGTIISTVFAVLVAGGSYFMGGFGRLYYSAEKIVYDDIVPTMLVKALPDILIGVVLIVVIAASISTLASLVLTSSSTLISDFIKSIFKKISPRAEFTSIRFMCIGFIAISVIIALIPNSLITSLMGLSWGALSGAFLGPFLYGLFWKKTSTASVWCSMIFGVGFVSLNGIIGFMGSAEAGAVAMIASLVIVPIVSLFTPAPAKEIVDFAFEAYNEKVLVSRKEALEENH